MKKTAKLLSILLALIMCLGIFSMAASAATTISKVEITGVNFPAMNDYVTYDFVIPSGVGYVNNPNASGDKCLWSETSTRPTSWADVNNGKFIYKTDGSYKFKDNKYYTFVIPIKAKSGYAFSSSLSTEINGYTAKYWASGATYNVWLCFDRPLHPINQITIFDVPNPLERISISWTFGYPIEGYGVGIKDSSGEGGFWSETDTKPTTYNDVLNGKKMYKSDNYFDVKPNKYYTFVANVKADITLWAFASNVTAKVDNNKANVMTHPTLEGAKIVWYCFGKTPNFPVGIEVTSPPKQTEYTYKSGTSTDGLKVVAKYSNGTTKDITDKVEVNGFDATNNKKGTHQASIYYKESGREYWSSFDYTVNYTIIQWVIMILLLGFIWY